MQGGADKGYDTFVASARRLAELDPCFRFHVAGSFGPDDADLGALSQRITFHGTQPAHRLSEFFAGMDLIISPNVRFRLTPGGFDGFPRQSSDQESQGGDGVPASAAEVEAQSRPRFGNVARCQLGAESSRLSQLFQCHGGK
jgi:glycosyltransferase involved in cell wall biosynthesis